jgi:hypothetical protein
MDHIDLLTAQSRIDAPDDLYNMLIRIGDGFAEEKAPALLAAVVLVLANYIGDPEPIRQAVAEVRRAFAAVT